LASGNFYRATGIFIPNPVSRHSHKADSNAGKGIMAIGGFYKPSLLSEEDMLIVIETMNKKCSENKFEGPMTISLKIEPEIRKIPSTKGPEINIWKELEVNYLDRKIKDWKNTNMPF
jgi:hypothetical protein